MYQRHLQPVLFSLAARLAVLTLALLCANTSFAARSPEITMRLNNMMHQVDRQLLEMRMAVQQHLRISSGVAGGMGDYKPSEDSGRSSLTVPEEQAEALVQTARSVASNGDVVFLLMRDIDPATQRVLMDFRSQSMRLTAIAEQIRSAKNARAEHSALDQMRRAIEATEEISRRYWQISPMGGR